MTIKVGDWVKRNNEYAIFEVDIAPLEIELEKLYEVKSLSVIKLNNDKVDCAVLKIGPVTCHLIEAVVLAL